MSAAAKCDRANPVDNHSERPDYRAEQGRFDATSDRLCDRSQVTPSTDLIHIAFRLGVGKSLTEPETWLTHRVAMVESQVVVYDRVEGSEVRINAKESGYTFTPARDLAQTPGCGHTANHACDPLSISEGPRASNGEETPARCRFS